MAQFPSGCVGLGWVSAVAGCARAGRSYALLCEAVHGCVERFLPLGGVPSRPCWALHRLCVSYVLAMRAMPPAVQGSVIIWVAQRRLCRAMRGCAMLCCSSVLRPV